MTRSALGGESWWGAPSGGRRAPECSSTAPCGWLPDPPGARTVGGGPRGSTALPAWPSSALDARARGLTGGRCTRGPGDGRSGARFERRELTLRRARRAALRRVPRSRDPPARGIQKALAGALKGARRRPIRSHVEGDLPRALARARCLLTARRGWHRTNARFSKRPGSTPRRATRTSALSKSTRSSSSWIRGTPSCSLEVGDAHRRWGQDRSRRSRPTTKVADCST